MSLNLKDVLESQNKRLYNDLKDVKDNAKYLLSQIVNNFPQYTPHDIEHSERVITHLDTIIPDNLKEKLNEYEIFFLLCSAYLHDVGMANLIQIKDYWGENPEIIRENHHKRSCIFIKKHYNEVGLKDRSQGKYISKICLGHRQEDLTDDNLFPLNYAYINFDINIALLSSLLRIGDELDITFERTPLLIYDNFDITNEKSKEAWETHFSVDGVTLIPNESKILCNATCEDPHIHRILKKLEVKINGQLDELPKLMGRYESLINELPRKFEMKIDNEGYEYHDYKFELDNKSILNLLVGENLYGSKYECIRELLKNSVDACKFRGKTTKKLYEPQITFELTSNNERLIVTDNGMGMDNSIIEEYFTKIGKSFFRSEGFLNQELDFNPLNELGIGFLSCFMITDELIIDTKTENSDPLEIEIDNTSDYFLVRKSERTSTGTKITLYLKEEIKEDIDLEKIIKNYARHLEFPISLILPEGKKIEINEREFMPCHFLVEQDPYISKINNSIIKIEEDDFEGSACLICGENSNNMKDIVFYVIREGSILSNQGILVNDKIKLLPELLNSLFSFDINLKKNILDLNIARNNIQPNDKYEKFLDKLELVILNKIRDFFIELKDLTNINSFINNVMTQFYNDSWKLITINSFFDKSDALNYVFADEKLPESYSKLFFDFYSFICVSNDGISFLNTNDLLTKRVIYVNLDLEGFVTRSMLEEYLEYLFKAINLDKECIYIIKPSYNSQYLLESFLGYKPQSFQEVLLNKYKDNLRLNDILAPFGEKNNIIIVNSNKYHDNRLILINFDNTIFINENNKLIQFIIENQDNLANDEKMAIEGLFNSFRNSFSVHKKYKTIIEMFFSNKKIKNDPSSYYLDKKELDLCKNNYHWKHE